MPGRDGTGPLGFGALTGNGVGFCAEGISRSDARTRAFCGRGPGLGLRCGRGRTFGLIGLDEKELLSAHKDQLEKRLNAVNKQLDKLQND